MKNTLMIILAAMTITACASISSLKVNTEGVQITREQINEIKPGSTTISDVIKTFGNPMKTVSKTDGTDILTYTYTEKKTPTYFREFIINEKRSKVTTITLDVTIKNGLVQSYNFAQEEKK